MSELTVFSTINPNEIQTAEPFVSLFPINHAVLDAMTADMKENGFNEEHAVIIWQQKEILLDGHHRKMASIRAGLPEIPCVYRSFDSEDDALDYVYKLQFNRRNITDSEMLLFCQMALQRYQKKYGSGSKAEFLSSKFNGALSLTKAKRICRVVELANDAKYADKRIMERVASGEITFNRAYEELRYAQQTIKSLSYDSTEIAIDFDLLEDSDGEFKWRVNYTIVDSDEDDGTRQSMLYGYGSNADLSKAAEVMILELLEECCDLFDVNAIEAFDGYAKLKSWLIENDFAEDIINKCEKKVNKKLASETTSGAGKKGESARKPLQFDGKCVTVIFTPFDSTVDGKKDGNCAYSVEVLDNVGQPAAESKRTDFGYWEPNIKGTAAGYAFEMLRAAEFSLPMAERGEFRNWLLKNKFVNNEMELAVMDYEPDVAVLKQSDYGDVYILLNGEKHTPVKLYKDTPDGLRAAIIQTVKEFYGVADE